MCLARRFFDVEQARNTVVRRVGACVPATPHTTATAVSAQATRRITLVLVMTIP
jgi:hypothetical protein